MRSIYLLLACAALLFGGSLGQEDYASCVAKCPQGGDAGYARGACIEACADQYPYVPSVAPTTQPPDYPGYKKCLANCATLPYGYAKQVCQTACVDEYIHHRDLATLVKKLNN
jgi:hypothetical protein